MMTSWFPRTVGHDTAKRALQRAVEGGVLPGSSLLILGPRGTGRALLAQELAQAASCEQTGSGPLPCESCTPCRKIAEGLCGDYVVLRPTDKASITIDQVRDMLDEMALAPVENPLRVFVVDPASKLREAAQNALLKGLEEPPRRALVVLIAEHEGELLSTIVSRCRVVRVGELATDQVEGILRQSGLSPGEAQDRARWSGGSPGMALEDDALDVAELTARTLEDFASGAAYRDPMDTGERLLEFATSGQGETAEAKRQRISKTLRLIARALRDGLAHRVGGDTTLSGADPALLSRLAGLPRGRLEAALDVIVNVEEELTRNANTKLVLDGLVLDVGAALAPSR